MNEVILSIIELFRENLHGDYKKIYYGEVRVPEQQYLPHVEVIPMNSKITNRGTGGMINNEFGIMIVVKTTMKKYLGSGHGDEIVKHTQDLVKRIEERNTDGTIKSNTVLGVLHDNLQLTRDGVRFADINGDWDISYEENDLGESFILYATISFVVKRIA